MVNFAGVLDVTMVAAAIGFAWLLMKAVSIVDICLAVVNSSEVVLDAVIGIVLPPDITVFEVSLNYVQGSISFFSIKILLNYKLSTVKYVSKLSKHKLQ